MDGTCAQRRNAYVGMLDLLLVTELSYDRDSKFGIIDSRSRSQLFISHDRVGFGLGHDNFSEHLISFSGLVEDAVGFVKIIDAYESGSLS